MNETILLANDPYFALNGVCFIFALATGFATARFSRAAFQRNGWGWAIVVGAVVGFLLILDDPGRGSGPLFFPRIFIGSVAGFLGALWFSVRQKAAARRAEKKSGDLAPKRENVALDAGAAQKTSISS